MQNTFLTDKQCESLSFMYFKVIKHIIPTVYTAPNVMLSISHPYNIKSVKKLQQIAHTTCLINCLNNTSTLGRVACIRLKQFQINNWIPKNILTTQILGKVDYKYNMLGKILVMTKEENLQIHSSHW